MKRDPNLLDFRLLSRYLINAKMVLDETFIEGWWEYYTRWAILEIWKRNKDTLRQTKAERTYHHQASLIRNAKESYSSWKKQLTRRNYHKVENSLVTVVIQPSSECSDIINMLPKLFLFSLWRLKNKN